MKKAKIAYLAPEIPALSATFVYNEILGLEERGFEIVPLSVHVPKSMAREDKVKGLVGRTHCLYRESVWAFILANIVMIFRSPIRYFRTLFLAISDSIRIGLTTHIGMGILYRFLVASRVAGILSGEGCQHLHAHFAHVPTDIAMYASKISGIPFSFTSHANDLFERGWLLKEKVERSRFAATISEHNRRFLVDQGAPREKIHIVRCGVHSSSFSTRGEKPLEEIPQIGTLGRMVEKKGFDDLVWACGILKDKGVAFHLDMAGDGPLEDDLQALVNSTGLSGEITFLGPLSHNQVSDWLRTLDLFALPCKRDRHGDMDGIPVVLMEAMLSGVPVISTRLSGIPELVEHGKTGFLADPDDPEGLGRAIQRLLSDESLRTSLRQNAIRKVQSEFDLWKNVEILSELFRRARP